MCDFLITCVQFDIDADIPSDAEASIRFLTSQFPLDAFEQRLPPIIMKHQVYSLVEDKTEADRELVRSCNLYCILNTTY